MPIQMTGAVNARVMLVGEFPHLQDLKRGEPFIGGAGFELTKMMAEAGLNREQCALTMVLKDMLPGGRVESVIPQRKKDIRDGYHVLFNGRLVDPIVVDGAEELRRDIMRVKPNVVCAMGNLALFVLTGQWGVGEWRSSIMESTLVPGLKVIPTHNPSITNWAWKERPMLVHDLKRVKRHEDKPEVIRTNYKFVIRPNFEEARSKLEHLLTFPEGTEMAVDIETRAGQISCIGIAWSDTESIVLPLMQAVEGNPHYWSEEEESVLMYLVYQLSRKIVAVGQNFNYDQQYFLRWLHFSWPRTKDTMVQQHSCFSNLPKNLAFLSSMYLEDHLYWKDDRTNWTEGPKGEGEDQYWIYCATDCVRTLAIGKVLDSLIRAMGVEYANSFQQRLAGRVLKAMDRGVRVNHEKRLGLGMNLMEQANTRQEYLQALLQCEFNIRSPKQMQDFFYRQMGMKPIIDRKTGSITTNDEALRTIAKREPILAPVVSRISELRSLGVFNSTFVQAALDTDGRMRTSYNIAGTETYRFSSKQNAFGTGMNMQNVPKGGYDEETGLDLPNIRELFIPDPGKTMWDIDLDSADLRIVTWESGCKWMKDQFAAGNKPYVEVMKEYYRDPTKSKHSPEYKIFKALCHGTNYLGTAEGLAGRVGLLVHETQRIQNWYYEMCPEIKRWQDDLKKQVESRRFVSNAFGYRTYFFDRIEGTIFNQAVAWIPQSTVAILINHIWEKLETDPRTKDLMEILLQVHDSLVGQYDSLQGDFAMRQLLEVANEVAVPYDDPLFIPVGAAKSTESWGKCG